MRLRCSEAQMLRIYAPIVQRTAISFELAPPSEEDFQERIRNTVFTHAWIVCEEAGTIAGYAYANRFRPREAYLWTTEVTVYVDSARQRRGLGRALYLSLFQVLRLQGYCTAIAVIALPNPPSVKLHEALGFKLIGVIGSAGYKFGKWHDTGWWQLELQPHPVAPVIPKPVSEWIGTLELAEALSATVPSRSASPAAIT
jgi:L-amino acid N-acyltransferase YncA